MRINENITDLFDILISTVRKLYLPIKNEFEREMVTWCLTDFSLEFKRM